MKKIYFLILISFFLFLFSPSVKAIEPDKVVINEVASAEVNGKDWIEIYNNSENDIDITDWQVLERTTIIKTFPSYILSSEEYIVLLFNEDLSDETADENENGYNEFYTLDTGLVNSDNVIILKNKEGLVIDALCFSNYDGTWTTSQQIAFNNIVSSGDWLGTLNGGALVNEPESINWSSGGKSGQSLGRDEMSTDSNKKDDFMIYKKQTPGDTNVIFSYSDKIIISEILPNPEGQDSVNEFIELSNLDLVPIDLENWVLKDLSGNTYFIDSEDFSQRVIIPPLGFFVLKRSTTGIVLNNTGKETLILINPNGEEIDEINYEPPLGYTSCPSGWSYNRVGEKWEWSILPTPGDENIILKEEIQGEEIPFVTIAKARKLKKGSQVVIEGIVSVSPGVLGKYIFYVQDKTSGIQVYYSKGKFPKLKIGDKVRIRAETSTIGKEKRIKIIKISDIKVLKHGPPPAPIKINIRKIREKYEGFFIKVSGKVSQSSGNTFYLSDGKKKIKIYIKSSSKIKKPKTKKNDFVEICGILSQTTSGYRILPRIQSDLKIIKQTVESEDSDDDSDLKSQKSNGTILGETTENFSLPDGNLASFKSLKTNQSSFLEILGWVIIGLGVVGLLGMGIWEWKKKFLN